jgi:TetR/AcrR family transcriptional regulator
MRSSFTESTEKPSSAKRSRGSTGRKATRLTESAGKFGPKVAVNLGPGSPGRRKRGDDVRQRVLTAALECFGAFGYEGTSTRAVAHRAKVTHTLVLYHFRSKEALWISMMDNVLHNYATAIENTVSDPTLSASDALRRFIERFVRLHAQVPQIHRILTIEGNQNTPRLKWVIEKHLRRHYEAVINLIRKGQMEGKVRQCDPARLYYLILGTGTPYTIATEYKEFTGRDVFSESEILRAIAFMYEIVFLE